MDNRVNTPMEETYYEILGIPKNADLKEVKRAYRRQTKNIIRTYLNSLMWRDS
jgi:hypothetical protein